jgi:site-specific DNA-methyltransferase (adenine-specific)
MLMNTDAGDMVLDPFLGTGTTAIAAKTLSRRFVGIELDPEYATIAETKLKNVEVSKHKGFYVSHYLDKIQSIRDIDASKIFPPQLTSSEKKRLRAANGNGHKVQPVKPKTNGRGTRQPKLLDKTAIVYAAGKKKKQEKTA